MFFRTNSPFPAVFSIENALPGHSGLSFSDAARNRWFLGTDATATRSVAQATLENEALQIHKVSLCHLAERESFERLLIEDEVAKWKQEAKRWKASSEMYSRRLDMLCHTMASEEADLEEGTVARMARFSQLEHHMISGREEHVAAAAILVRTGKR